MSSVSFPDTSAHEALPENVTPLHYGVHLFDIDVKKNTFSGITNIKFAVNSVTSQIVLHQKFLHVASAEITSNVTKTETKIPIKTITNDDKKQTVKFVIPEKIEKGTIEMKINFTGKIRTDMAGFYTSHYQNSKGKTEYILVTQFESDDARSAFPCYDEPASKATFDISLTVPDELTALSNMPVVSSKTLDSGKKGPSSGDKLKLVQFQTTPKMSTYLVAWAIGRFESISDKTIKAYRGKHLPITVYTIPGQSESGRFALSVAQKDVDYLSQIFDVEYPLPKLDLVAIPQFGAHAMENWGMVTFRATALLFDADKSDATYKQNVAYTVSHEIAHSWFGNFVTMSWWSHLWLNESFATFVGSLCVDHTHPEWETFTDFVTNAVEVALDLDSLRNSHPIEVCVNTASEIDEIFDPISYLKGGSIIRMVASAVGVETFLKGVSIYLKKYSFGNAKSDDLWDAVSIASGKDITALVSPWIRAVGFPYLSVTKQDDSHVKITQQRFLAGGKASKEEDKITWWIPNVPELAGGKREAIVPLKGFLKLNKDTVGFYRTIYDPELFDNILAHLDKLSSEDKIGLIGDAAAGSQVGLMKVSQLLDLLHALKDTETDVNVWTEAVKRLSTLKDLYFSDQKVLSELDSFSRDLFKPRFLALSSKKSSDLSFAEIKLRSLLFLETGVAGLPETISYAKKLFRSGNIEPSLKLGVYKTLLANKETCTDEVFNTVLNEAEHPASIDSTEITLNALGSIADHDKYLKEALSLFFSDHILEMDYSFLTQSLVKNPHTKIQFWNFFKLNYTKFRNDVAMWTLDRLIKDFVPKLISKDLYTNIRTFFATQDTTGYSKGLHQGLDSVKNSLDWAEAAHADISAWLSKKGY